jgi:hypothetical protein
MAKLNARKRNALPSNEFALPGRKYPINDRSHARNALARAAQNASPAQKAVIERKVHQKFPGIGQEGGMKEKGEKKAMKHSGGMKKMHKGEHEGHKAITAQEGRTMKMKKKG